MVGMGLPRTKMMRENGLGGKHVGKDQEGRVEGGGRGAAGSVEGVSTGASTSTSTTGGSACEMTPTPATPAGREVPGAGRGGVDAVGGAVVTVEDTTGSWATTDAVREGEEEEEGGMRDEDAVIDELVELMEQQVGLEVGDAISCDDAGFGKFLDELRAEGVCTRLKDLRKLLFGQKGMYKSRSRWALAHWRFLLHYTTNNHLESYHGTLKIARMIGAAVVRLHAVVRAIVAADKFILEGAHRRVEEAVGYSKAVAKAWEKVVRVGLVDAIAAVEAERFPDRSLTFKGVAARKVSLKLKLHAPRTFEWGLLGACIVMGSTERHLQSLMISMATLREELEATDVYAERTVAPEDPESGEWMVKGVYRVQLGEHAGGRLCTCPAFAGLGYICKHVLYVLFQVVSDCGGGSRSSGGYGGGAASHAVSTIKTVLGLIPAEYFTPQTLINHAHDALVVQEITNKFMAALAGHQGASISPMEGGQVSDWNQPSTSSPASASVVESASGEPVVVHGSPKKTRGQREARLEHVLSSPASTSSRSSQRAEQREADETEVIKAFTDNARLMRQLHHNVQNGSLDMYTDQELRVLCEMIKKTEMALALATEDEERGGRRMTRTRGPRSGRHGKVVGSSSGTRSGTSSSRRKRKRSGPKASDIARRNALEDPLPPADVSGVQRVKKHKSSARKSLTTAVRKVIG